MKIYFEDREDAYSFLKLCRLIAYVLEENEKHGKWVLLNADTSIRIKKRGETNPQIDSTLLSNL
jgi:hypothetical protein